MSFFFIQMADPQFGFFAALTWGTTTSLPHFIELIRKIILVFLHHPLFIDNPDEPDGRVAIPKARRAVHLDSLKSNNVLVVFAGHAHRNILRSDGVLQLVTSGAVGYPLGDDSSGFRIVKVLHGSIKHKYFGFDDVRNSL